MTEKKQLIRKVANTVTEIGRDLFPIEQGISVPNLDESRIYTVESFERGKRAYYLLSREPAVFSQPVTFFGGLTIFLYEPKIETDCTRNCIEKVPEWLAKNQSALSWINNSIFGSDLCIPKRFIEGNNGLNLDEYLSEKQSYSKYREVRRIDLAEDEELLEFLQNPAAKKFLEEIDRLMEAYQNRDADKNLRGNERERFYRAMDLRKEREPVFKKRAASISVLERFLDELSIEARRNKNDLL